MITTTITCDVCKRVMPQRSDKRDDCFYTFMVLTSVPGGQGRAITGPGHPDICRACLTKGFTVSMSESADVHFKLADDAPARVVTTNILGDK